MKLFLTLFNAVVALAVVAEPYYVLGDEKFIVGGRETTVNPGYVLSLQIDGKHICGATLIDGGIALTSARCLTGKPVVERGRLVAGASRLYNSSALSRQSRSIAKAFVHENYIQSEDLIQNYDIAILFLSEDFVPTLFVRRIRITTDTNFLNEQFLVCGWGQTSPAPGSEPNTLRRLTQDFYDDEYCEEFFGTQYTDSIICAGRNFIRGRFSPCDGDSGGPLVHGSYLVGILTDDSNCGLRRRPDLYTEVSYYVDWIKKQKDLHSLTFLQS